MAITTAMIKELRQATGAGILDSKKALEASEGNFDKAVEFLREKGLAKAAKKSSRSAEEGLITIAVDGNSALVLEVNCETDFVARTDDFGAYVKSIVDQLTSNPQIDTLDALLESDYQAAPGKTVAEGLQEAISKLGENMIIRRFARHNLQGAGVVEGYLHPGDRVGVVVELQSEGDEATLRQLGHDLALQIAAISPQYIDRDAVPTDMVEKEREILLAQLADEKKPDNIKEKIVTGRLNKFYEEITLVDQAFVKDESMKIGKLLQQTGKAMGAPVTVTNFTRFELGA